MSIANKMRTPIIILASHARLRRSTRFAGIIPVRFGYLQGDRRYVDQGRLAAIILAETGFAIYSASP